jgi:hypothetical protein
VALDLLVQPLPLRVVARLARLDQEGVELRVRRVAAALVDLPLRVEVGVEVSVRVGA